MTTNGTTGLWVAIHAVRTVPPSRQNRGEDGAPKTATYGGVERLRWSSQSQKRHWRMAFPDLLAGDAERLGVRTQQLPALVRERLAAEGVADDVADGMTELLQTLGKGESLGSNGDGTGKTATLLFLARDEIEGAVAFAKKYAEALPFVAPPRLATGESVTPAAPAGKGRKKAPKAEGTFDRDAELAKLRKAFGAFLAARGARTAVDVAMFGRFLTTEEVRSVDACVQVAHALGTTKHVRDYDYFTAVDDRETGHRSAHLGEVELASGVLYQHVALDVRALAAALGDVELTARSLRALLRAVALVTPTGGANGTAPHAPADYLDVEVLAAPPLNAVGAFDAPVRPTSEVSALDGSIAALRARLAAVNDAYRAPGDVLARVVLSLRPVDGDRAPSLDALTASVTEAVRAHLAPEAS